MRALLVLLSVVALLTGCVSRSDEWTRYPTNPGLKIVGGKITNNTGQDLHDIKITGRIWAHNRSFWIQPAYKAEVWDAGRNWVMNYRWNEIQGVRLTVYSREGTWKIHWPMNPSKPE
jgi:hypothetical protein